VLSLKVNDESRTLKNEFVDVTLNELVAAYKFVSNQDGEVKRYLLSEVDAEINQDKFFEFKIGWISLFSDFTIDELRLVPLGEDEFDGGSIEWLYNHCILFLKQPESYLDLKEFTHKGTIYKLIEPLKTIGGAKMLFGKGSFRQFMLGSQLTTMVADQKNERGIESLKQLFAMLYSDGKDSSEDIVKRANVFGEVNALYGWSAFFFFALLVEKYKDYFHLSTTENPPLKVKTVLAKHQLKQLLSKTIFGKLLPSRLLKQEFLILEM
jgi:hypothetical protein